MDSETVRSGRIREANHRIANHLSLLVGMVQLQMNQLEKGPEQVHREHVQGLLKATAGKLLSVGHLHRRLSEHPSRDEVDLGDYLVESCQTIVSALSLGGVVFSGKFEKDCMIAADRAQALALIASEVIMNAVKHAHPTGITVQIVLTCEKSSDGTIVVEISDDGIGLPEGFDPLKKRGYGFTVIQTLAQTAQATLDIESSDLGLTFRLRIPPQIA